MRKHVNGFIEFIREQGVVGLAIGFILGAAVAKVVSSLVSDIINPLIGLLLGSTSGLKEVSVAVGGAKLMVGNFLSVLLDFAIVAGVIYLIVKVLRLDRLDRKKDDKK